jgi:hypothetical protein
MKLIIKFCLMFSLVLSSLSVQSETAQKLEQQADAALKVLLNSEPVAKKLIDASKGLMAGLGIQGTKITKFVPKK